MAYFVFISFMVISISIWIHGNRYVSKPANEAPATGNYLSVFVWLAFNDLLYSGL